MGVKWIKPRVKRGDPNLLTPHGNPRCPFMALVECRRTHLDARGRVSGLTICSKLYANRLPE